MTQLWRELFGTLVFFYKTRHHPNYNNTEGAVALTHVLFGVWQSWISLSHPKVYFSPNSGTGLAYLPVASRALKDAHRQRNGRNSTRNKTAKSSTTVLDGRNSMEQSKNNKVKALTKCSTKVIDFYCFIWLASWDLCTDLMDRPVILIYFCITWQ